MMVTAVEEMAVAMTAVEGMAVMVVEVVVATVVMAVTAAARHDGVRSQSRR